jgi:hypothetical protein
LESILQRYQRANPSTEAIGGVILDIPSQFDNEEIIKEEYNKISSMVSHFSLVMRLSLLRCLMLFPDFIDRELIAHRLNKSLGIEIVFGFSAATPAEAIQKIQPYL